MAASIVWRKRARFQPILYATNSCNVLNNGSDIGHIPRILKTTSDAYHCPVYKSLCRKYGRQLVKHAVSLEETSYGRPISKTGTSNFSSDAEDGNWPRWPSTSAGAARSLQPLLPCNRCLQRLYYSDNAQEAKVETSTKSKGPVSYQTLNKDSAGKFRQTTLRIKETKDKMKEKVEEVIYRENVITVPNFLCVTRIVLSPVLGYLVLQHSYHYALGIFVFAGFTDLLDGMIARQFPSQQSMLGSFLDPMADKMLIALLFLTLTGVDLIPIPLTALIIARDLCLMGAGFYVRYVSLPPPKTLSRYFDITHATARLSPTFVSKINTLVQLALVGATLAAPVFHLVDHPALQAMWYITAATTVSSGLSYVFSKDTFKLLRQSKRDSLARRQAVMSEEKERRYKS